MNFGQEASPKKWIGGSKPPQTEESPSGFKSYNNVLFFDDDDKPGAPGGSEEVVGLPSEKLQQQRLAAAQKRMERLQMSGVATSSTPGAGAAGGPAAFPRGTSASGQGRDMAAAAVSAPSANGSRRTGGHSPSSSVSSIEDLEDAPLTVRPMVERQQSAVPSTPGGSTSGVPKPLRPPRPVPVKPIIHDMRAFLMQPGPRMGPIQCRIIREKGSTKMFPSYRLLLEGEGEQFLLSARKRKKSRSSNYVISVSQEDTGRKSVHYFGKIRSNFVGTEFTVYDKGSKPGKKSKAAYTELRQELGTVAYEYNIMGSRGPRKMTAVIPAVSESGQLLFRQTHPDDSLSERYRKQVGMNEVVVMHNKPPRWNDALGAYCLNFNGRVTEASVKNFQLIADDAPEHIILQFGKTGRNTFTMDYQWPMSAMQAFSICLSSFDNKLACE